jgi:hypothetical protein
LSSIASHGSDAEWSDKEATMDTKRIITFLLGTAVGVGLGGSVAMAGQAPAPARATVEVAPAPAGSGSHATTASAQRIVVPAGRRLSVALPADGDYISSSSIAVAGTAFGRPHGPRIVSVRVELLVGGRLIQAADLAVHSSRFAGVLELTEPMARTEAELRISDPKRPAAPSVVRRLTIQASPR